LLDLGVDRNISLKLIFKELCLGARVKSFFSISAMDFCEVLINLNTILKEIIFDQVFVNY